MRIAVDHTLAVTFPSIQPHATLALRVTPQDSHDQTVSNWRIGPDCDARLRAGRDGYGNVLTMVYAEGPIERIEFHVTGEIFTGPSNGILSADHVEPLPTALFLRAAEPASPELIALAVDTAGGMEDAIERLHLINVAFHRRANAIAGDTLAAAFAAAARRLTHPARCVSGYLAIAGSGRPHVWAEVHVEGIGWVGFDPWLGLSTGEDHVRIASALDLAGIAMIGR